MMERADVVLLMESVQVYKRGGRAKMVGAEMRSEQD